jgi:hypothetical protein
LFVLAAMLLINSPLVDFRKISVASQLARLESGKVALADFDFYYFRRELARPGYMALQKIKTDVAETNPEIVIKIDMVYRDYRSKEPVVSREDFLAVLKKPDGEIIPDDLGDVLYEWLGAYQWRAQNLDEYYLVRVDLNRDSQDDYVLVRAGGSFINGSVFSRVEGEWKVFEVIGKGMAQDNDIEVLLKQNKVEAIAPAWQQLKVGDVLLQVNTDQAD